MTRIDLLFDPFGARWPDMEAAAVAAAEAGFSGLWTWDHLLGSVHQAASVLECWTLLTGLASVVEDLAIGPLVLNVANRHPALVASQAATLQEMSGGRLLLGMGAGGGPHTPYAAEQRAVGRRVPADPVRREELAEAIAVIRQVWTGSPPGFEGRHYRLAPATGFPRPEAPPPIVVGAFGPKMAALAGRVADGINVQAFHPRVDDLVDVARRERADAGRAPEGFLVTAFAGLDQRWLDHDSAERSRLRRLDVDRLILVVDPPYDPAEIRAAGRLMARSRG
jgi:alkanesulfonate monooxygenase SsuD/methylene tetrahydromethanopterin reductase-like flavin-dependent oxidoreductase (luciferase family)